MVALASQQETGEILSKASKLYEQWREKPPKEAAYDDVLSVAKSFLGEENIREGKASSHTLIIDGPFMKIALEYHRNGLPELSWLQGSAFLSIPRYKGTKVKKVYIKNLMKLITFKVLFEAKSK